MRSKEHEKINYIEFPSKDLDTTKAFFRQAFAWQFTDYGLDYSAFKADDAGIEGGFYSSDLSASTYSGSALIVFYSKNLSETLHKIEAAGGTIVRACFEFPGGHRFHFTDPSGNEFAAWSDKA